MPSNESIEELRAELAHGTQTSVRLFATREQGNFGRHLLRLDPVSRRLRFGSEINDSFLWDYAARVDATNTVRIGFFENNDLRGAAELRSLRETWCAAAEAAFTVERDWRRRGIGTSLMHAIKLASHSYGVQRIHMIWSFCNLPMHRLAEKAQARIPSRVAIAWVRSSCKAKRELMCAGLPLREITLHMESP